MTRYNLPVMYDNLEWYERRTVREQYVREQQGVCHHCNMPLDEPAAVEVTSKSIMWRLFPQGFLDHPVHLHHDHGNGLTIGAVHAYCNAVLWQYYGEWGGCKMKPHQAWRKVVDSSKDLINDFHDFDSDQAIVWADKELSNYKRAMMLLIEGKSDNIYRGLSREDIDLIETMERRARAQKLDVLFSKKEAK